MATTLKQIESDPGTDHLWQRIEAYIAHRFSERAVTWIVEGPGEWEPPLAPATIASVDIWNGTAWETCTAPDAPLGGYWLAGEGPYRFQGTVGAGPTPAPVLEAYERLSDFLADVKDDEGQLVRPAGVSQWRRDVGDVSFEATQNSAWIARALELSGAADLLRPYRRA